MNKEELIIRLKRFCTVMNELHPDWDTAFFLSKVNQYYFMGTMQDGMLIIKKDAKAYYFVRRSFERAKDESPLDNIYYMRSYRDAASVVGADCGNTYMETEIATLGIVERLKKHFSINKICSLDKAALSVRAVKSPYELSVMEESGKQHNEILKEFVPSILKEGMSEADFAAELLDGMIKRGYQGISRFSMFQTEMVMGQMGFGESSLYPTSFDGPGGAYGMCPAVPLLGSRQRKLKKGDLVFVDIAYGVNGYHSDKTQVYMFGGKPDSETIKAHRGCIEVEKHLSEQLKPGAIPSVLYKNEMDGLSDDFKNNFMGFAGRQAKFLGHGIGLYVDELPIVAYGFDDPLAENMTISLEPKKGVPGIGLVGVEDTYVVTSGGGRCITGGGSDIIII